MDTHHVDDVNSFQGVPQDSKSREMIDKEKKAELNSSIFGEIMSYFIISWGFETAEDGKVFTSSFKACKKEFHWRPVLFLESDIWSERLLGDEGIKRCPIKTQKNVKKSSEGVDEKPLDVGEVNPPSMHAWQYWSLDKLTTIPRNQGQDFFWSPSHVSMVSQGITIVLFLHQRILELGCFSVWFCLVFVSFVT